MRNLLIGFVIVTALTANLQVGKADIPAEDALVFFLTFDEGKGQVAEDASPNGFQARLEGTYKWVKDGKVGGAIEFTSGRAIVSDDDRLDVEQLTATAWIFPTEISDTTTCHNWGNMIYQKSGASDDSVEFVLLGGDGACLYINSGPGGNKRMGPFDGADVDNNLTLLNLGIETDKWYHITGTFDGENIRIYLDGELAGERAIFGDNPSIVWNDNDSSVGGRSHNESWFVGMIDEFALFNRALTESEIKQMMSGKLAVDPRNNLTSMWGGIKIQ
jgi:hypothetical protein